MSDSTLPALSLSVRSTRAWRIVQAAVWCLGLAMIVALLVAPEVGLHAFWNVLIPVAPALLVFAPGVWRNVCPLGSTALVSRHLGLSAGRSVSGAWQARLALGGVLLLLTIVPLRHAVLDRHGPSTAYTLILLAAVAFGFGLAFEWKSGWCSGLCPVHPVEKFYGSKPAVSPPNAHCVACARCVTPCLDSTPAIHPLSTDRFRARRWAGVLLVGGFPGFIWGWFQVPDYAAAEGLANLAHVYGWPLLGLSATLALYLLLERTLRETSRLTLVRVFAVAAVGCYYWFRLPALFGFAPVPGDGMLVDLRATLPAWFPWVSRAATTALFLWWFLLQAGQKRAWDRRPEYA